MHDGPGPLAPASASCGQGARQRALLTRRRWLLRGSVASAAAGIVIAVTALALS
jgi:hypothetical protein